MKIYLKPIEEVYEAKTRLGVLDALITDHLCQPFRGEELDKAIELAHVLDSTPELLRRIAIREFEMGTVTSAEDANEYPEAKTMLAANAILIKALLDKCADDIERIRQEEWEKYSAIDDAHGGANADIDPRTNLDPQN